MDYYTTSFYDEYNTELQGYPTTDSYGSPQIYYDTGAGSNGGYGGSGAGSGGTGGSGSGGTGGSGAGAGGSSGGAGGTGAGAGGTGAGAGGTGGSGAGAGGSSGGTGAGGSGAGAGGTGGSGAGGAAGGAAGGGNGALAPTMIGNTAFTAGVGTHTAPVEIAAAQSASSSAASMASQAAASMAMDMQTGETAATGGVLGAATTLANGVIASASTLSNGAVVAIAKATQVATASTTISNAASTAIATAVATATATVTGDDAGAAAADSDAHKRLVIGLSVGLGTLGLVLGSTLLWCCVKGNVTAAGAASAMTCGLLGSGAAGAAGASAAAPAARDVGELEALNGAPETDIGPDGAPTEVGPTSGGTGPEMSNVTGPTSTPTGGIGPGTTAAIIAGTGAAALASTRRTGRDTSTENLGNMAPSAPSSMPTTLTGAGPQEATGPQSDMGPQGTTGPQGAMGPQGVTGPQDAPGRQGTVGSADQIYQPNGEDFVDAELTAAQPSTITDSPSGMSPAVGAGIATGVAAGAVLANRKNKKDTSTTTTSNTYGNAAPRPRDVTDEVIRPGGSTTTSTTTTTTTSETTSSPVNRRSSVLNRFRGVLGGATAFGAAAGIVSRKKKDEEKEDEVVEKEQPENTTTSETTEITYGNVGQPKRSSQTSFSRDVLAAVGGPSPSDTTPEKPQSQGSTTTTTTTTTTYQGPTGPQTRTVEETTTVSNSTQQLSRPEDAQTTEETTTSTTTGPKHTPFVVAPIPVPVGRKPKKENEEKPKETDITIGQPQEDNSDLPQGVAPTTDGEKPAPVTSEERSSPSSNPESQVGPGPEEVVTQPTEDAPKKPTKRNSIINQVTRVIKGDRPEDAPHDTTTPATEETITEHTTSNPTEKDISKDTLKKVVTGGVTGILMGGILKKTTEKKKKPEEENVPEEDTAPKKKSTKASTFSNPILRAVTSPAGKNQSSPDEELGSSPHHTYEDAPAPTFQSPRKPRKSSDTAKTVEEEEEEEFYENVDVDEEIEEVVDDDMYEEDVYEEEENKEESPSSVPSIVPVPIKLGDTEDEGSNPKKVTPAMDENSLGVPKIVRTVTKDGKKSKPKIVTGPVGEDEEMVEELTSEEEESFLEEDLTDTIDQEESYPSRSSSPQPQITEEILSGSKPTSTTTITSETTETTKGTEDKPKQGWLGWTKKMVMGGPTSTDKTTQEVTENSNGPSVTTTSSTVKKDGKTIVTEVTTTTHTNGTRTILEVVTTDGTETSRREWTEGEPTENPPPTTRGPSTSSVETTISTETSTVKRNGKTIVTEVTTTTHTNGTRTILEVVTTDGTETSRREWTEGEPTENPPPTTRGPSTSSVETTISTETSTVKRNGKTIVTEVTTTTHTNGTRTILEVVTTDGTETSRREWTEGEPTENPSTQKDFSPNSTSSMGEKVQKEVSTSTGTDGVQVVTERTTTTHKNGKRTVLEVILTDGKETGRKEWELKQDEILAPLGISPSTTTSSQAARGHEMTRTRSVTKGDYYEEEYSSDEEQDSVDETKQADKQESSPVVKGKVKKPETQYRGVVYSRFHNRPTIYSRKDAFKIRGDAKPGTVIMNRYKLGEVMETVKQRQVVRQAQDQKEENKDVTLKFVSNVNTFQLEAVVLRYLSSPYTQELVATYEVPPSRTPYILVKSHHPFTLAQYLLSEERKDTTITTSMVLRQHVRSIVTAVDWCHQHGIAHMDLHPLHFTRDSMDSCTWRLCDFGLAAFVHEDAVREVTSSYAAPEVVRALHARKTLISRASMDLWSLGVTLYELYVGRPLFEDDKMARKTLNADQVAPISLDAIQDPMALAQIKRLVRLDPARRITAGKLLQTEYLSVAEE